MDLNKMTDLEKIAKVWQLELNMEFLKPEKNVRLSFKDIGAFGEYIATNLMPGYVGGGSGGMGFDLMNFQAGKALEVKSCCTIQNAKCPCGTKFNNLFYSACPDCGSKKFYAVADSRFGINAAETLRQIGEGIFAGFVFCHASKIDQDISNNILNIKVDCYTLDFSDDEIRDTQLAYFVNQATKGRKAICNLLPNKIDFYKLCPLKIYEVEMSINYADLNQNPIVKEQKVNEYPRVPIGILQKKEIADFVKLKTFDSKTQTADCKDFTLSIVYRKKTLGKGRGDTRGNLDKRIKKTK